MLPAMLVLLAIGSACQVFGVNLGRVGEVESPRAKYAVAVVEYTKLLVYAHEFVRQPDTPVHAKQIVQGIVAETAKAREAARLILVGCDSGDAPDPLCAASTAQVDLLLFGVERLKLELVRQGVLDVLEEATEAGVPPVVILLMFNLLIALLRSQRQLATTAISELEAIVVDLIETGREPTPEELAKINGVATTLEQSIADA